MPRLTVERWRRVEPILDHALELPPEARASYLDSACEGDVELRYDPSDEAALPRVFVGGRFVCDTVPLDLHRNALRRRKLIEPVAEPLLEATGIDVLGDIEREHYERIRFSGEHDEGD